MNKHFHVPLDFSSEDEGEYDYDYSYDDDDTPKSEIALKEKRLTPTPIQTPSPHRATRSNILRPIQKTKASNVMHRPQTSESILNSQINLENNPPTVKNIIEHDIAYVDEHFYTIEMKRFKSLFGSSHKRFLMVEENKLIFDLTIKSKDKLIGLPNKHHLEVSKGHTEFSLKSDEQFKKEIMKINFNPPHEEDECKRRTVVRFINMKNISLPRKITSLGNLDDDNFNGHYHIPSVRNTALVVQGSKTPVLTILELEKNRIEIRTVLNIDKEIVFALAITAFLGKNCSEKNGFIQGIKGLSFSPSLLIGHDKVII